MTFEHIRVYPVTMRTNYLSALLLSFCFLSIQASAQSYYPGGLGNSNLFLWLNANNSSSITKNGSNQVSQWADLSGNGFNFTQSTTGNKPVYGATANPGGRPGLTFTSTNSQYLSLVALPSSLSFTAGISAFAQASYNTPQTTQGWQRIFDFGNGTAANNFMMGENGSTNDTYYEGWKGNSGDQTWTTSSPITFGSEDMFEAIQQSGTAGTLTNVAQYNAGATQTVNGQAGSSQTWLPIATTRTASYLGHSNWTADNYFGGTMSEILLYNTAVNTTQRVILENYLSAEWNQSVSVLKYTPPTTTTYTTNLVGIGAASGTDNFLTDVAGSTDGLGFSSGTAATDFLKNTGYLMAAHNAQANTVITNASVPGITSGSSLSRWNRSWNVQKTGGNNAGAVTLNFNFPDYNGTAPSAAITYSLLYNATDGSFATGTNVLVTTTSTTVAGNNVAFKLTASNLSNGYYTILYSTTAIFLPVTLTTFTAVRQGSSALLGWSTAEQFAFSHFSIERSGDGASFSSIATVAASVNSTTTDQYSFLDNDPKPGMNYYRLALVDQDGTVAYSAVRSVSFDNAPALTLTVYPNPVVSELHLAVTGFTGKVSIRLVNSQGQVMRTMESVAAATVAIPVDGLARGIYFLELNGTEGHYVREIEKR